MGGASIWRRPNGISLGRGTALSVSGKSSVNWSATGATSQWIPVGPVRTVHGVEPHPPIADMDPQSIAIVLEFVRPAFALRWTLGDGRTTRNNETGRRGLRPAARVTHYHLAEIGGALVCGNFKIIGDR